MEKLLAHGKSDLLQFVSARTRRPFSAFLVRQPDGKVGFEFEAKKDGKGRGRPQRAAALRVLGKHPRDGGAGRAARRAAMARTSSTAKSTPRCPTATRWTR